MRIEAKRDYSGDGKLWIKKNKQDNEVTQEPAGYNIRTNQLFCSHQYLTLTDGDMFIEHDHNITTYGHPPQLKVVLTIWFIRIT